MVLLSYNVHIIIMKGGNYTLKQGRILEFLIGGGGGGGVGGDPNFTQYVPSQFSVIQWHIP